VLAPEDSIAMFEGCLSVTGLRGQVVRPRRVRVQALDRQGKPLDFVWEGVRASVVQSGIYYHFETKADLFDAAIAAVYDSLDSAVEAARLEVKQSQLRMCAQVNGCKISSAGLRLLAKRLHSATYLSPGVDLVRHLKGQLEIGAGYAIEN